MTGVAAWVHTALAAGDVRRMVVVDESWRMFSHPPTRRPLAVVYWTLRALRTPAEWVSFGHIRAGETILRIDGCVLRKVFDDVMLDRHVSTTSALLESLTPLGRVGCHLTAFDMTHLGDDMSGAERNDLLTPAEVAELFRVNPRTVTRWAQAGKISTVRTLGGHRRFRRSEIDGQLRSDDTIEV